MKRTPSYELAFVALTLFCGCDVHETLAPAPGPMKGTLTLELRESADVQIITSDGNTSKVTIQLSDGFGFAPAKTALEAPGTVEAFPEANSTLYTAKISVPAMAEGPCGDSPVSLAMSLYREGANHVVLGGLSAYCGVETWHGTPQRVLRLHGDLSSSP